MYRIFYNVKFEPDKHFLYVDPERSAGIATVFWLEGSGFELRWSKIFSLLQRSRSAEGLNQPPVKCVPVVNLMFIGPCIIVITEE